MRKKRQKVRKVSKRMSSNNRTVIVDEKVERVSPKKRSGRYFVSVLVGALVVVFGLLFLTYKSFVVLFPWMFGNESQNIQKQYITVSVPVWNSEKGSWKSVKHEIADAGDEFTVSYVFSQFTASHGFSMGYDTGYRLRIVSVEESDSGWNVYMVGSGVPFYTSPVIRRQICKAIDILDKSVKGNVDLYYDGMNIRDYIPCDKSDGIMVFYVRGSSVRARWVYISDSIPDIGSRLRKVFHLASQYGDTNLEDMITGIDYTDNILIVKVKENAFVEAPSYVRNALIYNMMYLYPYISTIKIEDPASLPYTDVRLDPIVLIPTTGEDFLVSAGDRLTFTTRLKELFPVISSIKIGNGRAVVDFKEVPSRSITEAVLRSLISSKNVSSVVVTVDGEVVPFWSDPFEEDF